MSYTSVYTTTTEPILKSPMRNILFVITKSNWGGAQRYVFDLARSLSTPETRVAVALGGTGLPGAPAGALDAALSKLGIKTHFVPAFMRDVSVFSEWRAFWQLYSLFVQQNPEVVHLNSSKAGGIGALAATFARVPRIVFTVHGLPWEEERGLLGRLLIRFVSWITFLLCHRVIVLSGDALAKVKAMPFVRSKVSLVHNGLPLLEFAEPAEARTMLGLPAETLVIGAVGELTWNKGYHVLLRAAGILKRRGLDFLLCIAGDGEERTFLETLATEENVADRVRFAGFVADAHRLLRGFNLFVLPSVKEGLPYVLLEAGQAGLAVVASTVGGVPEIIADRRSGLHCNPKDHTDLADKLQELITDAPLRERLGRELRERVSSEFSLAHMVAETVKTYR